MNLTKKAIRLVLLLVVAVLLLASCGESSGQTRQVEETDKANSGLQVVFLNVGKGDAAFIEIPGGYYVMIDTGPEEGFPEVGRRLIQYGVTNLSAVFITHGHNDHIGSLNEVLSLVECKKIYTSRETLEEKEISNAMDENIDVEVISSNQTINIGEAAFTVIGPVEDYKDKNNNSIVIMFEYKGTKILFAADQLSEAENGLLNSGVDLRADVLKVAHHGSNDSSSAEFVNSVNPKYAVISTDKSTQPSQQVLDNISKSRAEVFVLGNTGTIIYNGYEMLPAQYVDCTAAKVLISEKDTTYEYVIIKNLSNYTVDLTGWCLFSKRGAETYFFQKGTAIQSNEEIIIYSGEAAQNNEGFVWSVKNIWSNKKEDECVLYDNCGRQISALK